MKLNLYDTSGKKLTPLELKAKDFGVVNKNLLAQALRVYEFNSHQKTSKAKNRGEVTGSRRKIYRQKGTGNARHSDRYAPIFVGGGVAHGPDGLIPANLVLPKKMKKKALSAALTLKLENNELSVLSLSPKLDGKTSTAAKLFASIASHPKNKTLVITRDRQETLYNAVSNLQKLTLKRSSMINARDIMRHDHIIFTKDALLALATRLGLEVPAKSIKNTGDKPALTKPTARKAAKVKKEAK